MTRALALLLTLLPLLAGCTGDGKTDAKKTKHAKRKHSSSSSDDDAPAKTGDDAENPLAEGPVEPAGTEGLQALMEKLQAAQKAHDADTLAEIARNLLPTFEQARKALAEDCDPKLLANMKKAVARRPADDDPRWAKMFRYQPKRTQIQLHPATTEQIASKAPESREFPGGAIRAAQRKVLRAGMTFYEVEFTEPGKDLGMKYHLFFHDGTRWRMLGKIWRALPR